MATTYDKASLVMIPSGYKDDKLYSVKPTDGSGDFTFSRDGAGASPATRVNASGLIEKGRTNIAIYSEDATNAVYAKSNISVTANNATSPIGTATADTITATANGATLQGVVTAVSGRVYTMSVYIKRRTGTGQVGLRGINNLVTNVTITNDWQRYEVFMVSDSTTGRYGVYLATAGDEVDVWGFQLEESLTATEYIATTATAVSAGLLGDMPRLDYSGGATCPSLLLEPSRVNVLDHSEYFDAWIKANISVANNVSTSPEGVQNATTIDVVSDTSFSSLRRNISVSANSTYTMSLFVKKETSETNYMGLGFVYSGGTTDVGYVIIDSVNGTALSADPRIDVITNVVDFGDYWRIEATATDSGSNTSLAVYIYATLSINGTSVAVGAGSTRTIYGAQLEAASYPTSYIPTYGSAASVAYDALNDLDLDGIFSGNSYTILFDIDLNSIFSNKVFAEAKKSTGSSSFTFRNFQGLLRVYNNLDSNYLTGSIASDSNKWVVRIDGSTADIFSYNSGSPTKTNGTALTTIRDFGKINFSGGPTISSLNQFLIFPTALTDAECNSLVQ